MNAFRHTANLWNLCLERSQVGYQVGHRSAGQVKEAKFDSTKLKNAIEAVITHQGISKTEPLIDEQQRGCKV